ncbi:hypothetical protein MMC21_003869 [Puttea exsequens]|nr:hypothetical protein [Puttea exsequens]
MHYSTVALAASPILFAASSFASYGTATVKNSCGDEAYFWSCGDDPGTRITIAAGSSHSEAYYSKSGGGGPSLKIASKYASGPRAGDAPQSIFDQPQPNITQFEYTVGTPGPPANAVFYDISNINGYPFVAGGLHMTSSDGKVDVHCPKDVQYCQAAYNAPHDDHATGSAAEVVDLIMELCSDAPGVMAAGGSSSGGSSSPQPSHAAPAFDGSNIKKGVANNPVHQPVVHEKLAAANPTPPATTPPPTLPKDEDDVIVWVTHTAEADEIVTKHVGPDGKTWVNKGKRDTRHVHQHVHNKVNKKRHANF